MTASRFLDTVRTLAAIPFLAALLVPGGQAYAEALTLKVQDADGRPIAGAVVMLRSLDRELPPAAPVSEVIEQLELAFKPGLVVVPVGSKVAFPNSDIVSHQVYSFSPAKKFQLPLYRGKPYPPVVFDTPGIVTLGCNIHDGMLGHVVVSDAPFNGIAGADGGWLAPVLPAGRYEASVWHPRLRSGGKPWTQQFEVTTGQGQRSIGVQTPQSLRSDKPTVVRSGWDSY